MTSLKNSSRAIRAESMVAVGAVVLVGMTGFGATAKAETPAADNFNLSSQAQSIDVLVSIPGAPLVTAYQVGAYGSSAKLDSLGSSFADAGAPYSPLANSLPGTVNGVGVGSLPPLPPLPGYVYASSPDRVEDNQSQGVYSIDAVAAPERAVGTVGLGGSLAANKYSTFFSSATAEKNADGSVTAAAAAGADLLNLSGLLDLGNVSSVATLTKRAGEAAVYTVSTKLGTVTAAGTGFGPEMALTPDMIDSLNTSLAPSGISLNLLPVTYTYADGSASTRTAEKGKEIKSVDSGGLQVVIAREFKDFGLVTTTTTLGRVFLAATADSDESGSALGPLGEALGGPIGGPGGAALPTTDGIGLGIAVPAAAAGIAVPDAVAGNIVPTTDLTTVPSATSGGAQAQRVSLSTLGLDSVENIYAILALAAILAVALAQLLGFFAVRLGRKS